MKKEISITEIKGIRIGHGENTVGGTGCTVILCGEQGLPAGVDVRGGGPASRETELLRPTAACERIHALLLSGGSAFGLDAAGGVMQYLEERNIGFDTGVAKVPLVCQSCIFDLGIGDKCARPGRAMAYAACKNAENNKPAEGCVGAGTGASVGKLLGMERAVKSGIGIYAVQVGALQVGAVVCVNAMGDVYDIDTGAELAGLTNPERTGFLSTEEIMYQLTGQLRMSGQKNTTIGAVITNAAFDKTHISKVAAMAQNGLARTIRPVHTMLDGDSVYAISTEAVEADINVVGTLAAYVLGKAVNRGVLTAHTMLGLPCAQAVIKKQ